MSENQDGLCPTCSYEQGQIVHIDTDNKQWGRVASDATVLENSPKRNRTVLVNVKEILADIVVPKQDVFPRDARGRLRNGVELTSRELIQDVDAVVVDLSNRFYGRKLKHIRHDSEPLKDRYEGRTYTVMTRYHFFDKQEAQRFTHHVKALANPDQGAKQVILTASVYREGNDMVVTA